MMMDFLPYKSLKPVYWPITPDIHAAIIKVYQGDSGNGQVRDLAKRIGYPRWKISRYAIQCGLIAKQKKEPNWSDREIRILEGNAYRSPETIQRKLKKYGFSRSATAIVLKRKRMRMLKNLDGMSANSLADCLGVDGHFILKAINGGRLKAIRRGTARTELQGGDTYFIRNLDIRRYVLDYLNEIDIRKVSKWWFCDLLVGGK